MNDQKHEEEVHARLKLQSLPRLTRSQVSLLIQAVVKGEYEFAKDEKELS